MLCVTFFAHGVATHITYYKHILGLLYTNSYDEYCVKVVTCIKTPQECRFVTYLMSSLLESACNFEQDGRDERKKYLNGNS